MNLNINHIRENLYVIIPIVCVIFWSIIFLISTRFDSSLSDYIYFDFIIFYGAGKQIFRDPSHLYSHDYGYDIGYTYMPSFATLFSISISLLPYVIGYFTLYFINTVLGIFFIREYNRILILINLKKKIHIFIFLIIIYNGFILFNIFRQNQVKFGVGLIFLFILRREIQKRKEGTEKTLKYYLINYGLLVFAIGMTPYFIFFLLIVIFHDIRYNEIFKKENVKIYIIVVLMFVIQNFLFILYPSLIFEFLNGFYKNENFFLFYLDEWVVISNDQILSYFNIISTLLLFLITFILISNSKLKLEKEFAYFSISALFISLFANRTLSILLPLTLLLFVPFLNQDEKGTKFIKSNIILLIGLISVAGIYLNINSGTIFIIIITIIQLLDGSILIFIIFLRWIILLCIMATSLLMLNLKHKKTS